MKSVFCEQVGFRNSIVVGFGTDEEWLTRAGVDMKNTRDAEPPLMMKLRVTHRVIIKKRYDSVVGNK